MKNATNNFRQISVSLASFCTHDAPKMKQDYYILGCHLSSERYIKVACHIVFEVLTVAESNILYTYEFVSGDPGRLCVQPLGYWDGGFESL
jgi:hypothetical protein